MYYVIFHYKEGRQELGVKGAAYESDIINFIHDNYKEIDVHRIIEVKAEYRLALVVTEDHVKSVLEPEKETEPLVELGKKPEEILKENKKTLEELEAGEPSAISKIAEEIEEEIKEDELTPEQRTKKSLDDADELIEREKLRKEQKDKGWALCTECNSNRVAPWNKKKICSECQNKRKTDRPYSRSKEFSGL